MTLRDDLQAMAEKSWQASREMAVIAGSVKNDALLGMADALLAHKDEILAANARDLEAAEGTDLPYALRKRLELNEEKVAAMARACREVAALPDPVGEVFDMVLRPNGLRVGKMRVPIGVVLTIYESRPNVTCEAAVIALSAGNCIILRGGKEALHSNLAIARVLADAGRSAGLPEGALQILDTTDRDAVGILLGMSEYIDLVVPRGGEGLIRAVVEQATMPVMKHFAGVCHTYVDAAADLTMAETVCYNAKVQYPAVCNAMETMLVHADVAEAFLPAMCRRFVEAGVELRGCERTRALCPGASAATEEDWGTEYNDLILSVKVVGGFEEALDHIARYGTRHSEAIITDDYRTAQRFLACVDAAAVYVNASTRFTDGGQFGLGAEMGISTDKFHARGPCGLRELTTYKWIIYGDGQIRT